MIAIIDYGAGNLQSVFNAVKTIGFDPVVTDDYKQVEKADVIIAPGVGSFADCFGNLQKIHMVETLREMVLQKKKPFLGICIGLQLLAKKSYEFGEHEGLGWINGRVIRINDQKKDIRVPHMGWNSVDIQRPGGLFAGFEGRPSFYFVHSYFFQVEDSDKDVVTSTCQHGDLITASVQKDNIFAVQFHPEKSQDNGLKLLSNFFQMIGY